METIDIRWKQRFQNFNNAFRFLEQAQQINATNIIKKGSDIDIAILGTTCTNLLALNLNAELNERTPIPYFCDVLNFSEINNPKLKEHITRVGKLFYDSKQLNIEQ